MNFQNLPRDSPVKESIIPKLDALVFVDYSSIEMRLLGMYLAKMGDTSIVDEVQAGLDPHMETAKRVFRTDSPTKDQRQIAKTTNFAVVYGIGTELLSHNLEITYGEAAILRTRMHAARPTIRTLMKSVAEKASTRGWVFNAYGRKYADMGKLNYKLTNYLIQGTAADMFQEAVMKVSEELRERNFKSHLINLVHDEMIADCTCEELDDVVELIQRNMKDPLIEEWIPIDTEASVTYTNWAEKVDYGH